MKRPAGSRRILGVALILTLPPTMAACGSESSTGRLVQKFTVN